MSGLSVAIRSMRDAVRISRGPFATMGAVGLFWGTFAAMVPVLKDQIGASDAQLGTTLIGGAIGGTFAMYFAPRVANTLGRHVLPLLTLVMAVVLLVPIFVHSIAWFFGVMALIGMSIAALDINANMRLSQLEERHSAHLMNVNHAMYSLCFGGAALFVSMLRRAEVNSAVIYAVMALVIVVVAILSVERDWRPAEEGTSQMGAPSRLPWLLILMTSVMLCTSFIGENATETWSALFIERELGGHVGEGGLGPATLGGVMCIVRLLGQVFVTRLGEPRMLIGSGVLGIIGALVLASAPTQFIALMGIGVIACGMAVIVPTANALLGKSVHKDHRALAISRAWMFGMSGFFIGPTLIGYISELWGLRIAFVAVAILVAAILPAVFVMQQKRPA